MLLQQRFVYALLGFGRPVVVGHQPERPGSRVRERVGDADDDYLRLERVRQFGACRGVFSGGCAVVAGEDGFQAASVLSGLP
jgi:hypothetical protein